jgi:hypothetical protein
VETTTKINNTTTSVPELEDPGFTCIIPVEETWNNIQLCIHRDDEEDSESCSKSSESDVQSDTEDVHPESKAKVLKATTGHGEVDTPVVRSVNMIKQIKSVTLDNSNVPGRPNRRKVVPEHMHLRDRIKLRKMQNVQAGILLMKTEQPQKVDQELPFKDPNPYPENPISAESLPPLPRSFKQARKHLYSDKFAEAEKAELNSLASRGVYTPVPRPMGRKILRSKWVYDYKINQKTDPPTLERFKARWCGDGSSQTEGVDFTETYSPVVKIQSIRIMIAIALLMGWHIEQMDVSTAFLYGDLDIPNYCNLPEGYVIYDRAGYPLCAELHKALYGLHQAGRLWYRVIRDYLVGQGFEPMATDPCLFKKMKDGVPIFIMLYVDDLMLVSNDKALIEEIKTQIKKRFEVKDMGDAQFVIGLQLERFGDTVYLGQANYTKELLKEADMWDCSEKTTPMETDWKHDAKSPRLSPVEETRFRSILMKISYLAQQTRPDLMFAVYTLAQYQSVCTQHDMIALTRIMRYLRGTWDLGLTFTKDVSGKCIIMDQPDLRPEVYADASYAQEEGRKSRSGYVFLIAGAAVTWFSKNQPTVALSSTEAEYKALSDAVKEVLWIKMFIKELGLEGLNDVTINQDNLSTIAIAKNPIGHARMKHVDVTYHFLRDHVEKQDVKLVYCPTEDMVADVLTKALATREFRKFIQLMGLRSLSDLRGAATAYFVHNWRLNVD